MKHLIYVLALGLVFSCNSRNETTKPLEEPTAQNYNLLSLGDSYTIGESVCDTCRFPEQLKDSLNNTIDNSEWDLRIIAQTGWTTTNLLNAIDQGDLSDDYDLVTLLIGVNNQFQQKPFALYEEEFPLLVDEAIDAVQGDLSRVIVLSIPDYAFTPFGQSQSNSTIISDELNAYNAFAQGYCESLDISFLQITDITRQGINNPNLVASDGLHPSALTYSLFVERLLPLALQKLE